MERSIYVVLVSVVYMVIKTTNLVNIIKIKAGLTPCFFIYKINSFKIPEIPKIPKIPEITEITEITEPIKIHVIILIRR